MAFDLHFLHPSTLVTTGSQMYLPPSFPPPDNWIITIDEDRKPLSRYGDDYWDYSAFDYCGFNFTVQNLSENNLRLVKQALLLSIYHPKIFPGKVISNRGYFTTLCKIGRVCDQQGILISELSKFPRLHSKVAKALGIAQYHARIACLHKLRLYREDLGFVIADERTLAYLASQKKHHEEIQHPYIPPRIWSYQVNRLNECIDEFIQHQVSIVQAFRWLSEAYEYNASLGLNKIYCSPFNERKVHKDKRILFDGTFDDYLKAYGLYALFEKWLVCERHSLLPELTYRVSAFSRYFTLVRDVSLHYIMNFSLQRNSEIKSLRSDCFLVERDEKLGDIALIVGETTKTDPDSNARWVVSKTVEKAVEVASVVANLRMQHRPKDVSFDEDVVQNPYLTTPAMEPWTANRNVGKKVKINFVDLSKIMRRGVRLFDKNKLVVTEDDYRIALSLTPNLEGKKWFGLGKPWRLTGHQFRRTTSVNMFSSGMVSDHSLQWAMKHLQREMTLYYGRNHSNLRLNSEAERLVIIESYQAIYRQLVAVVEDSIEYVRPHEKEMIPTNVINLVGEREEKQLTNLIQKGSVGCRPTLLGFCLRPGSCEYGGIESVAKCAGADGGGICVDAVFARKNEAELIHLRKAHKRELKTLEKDSMRYSALKQEVYAIGVYLDVLNR